MTTSYWQRGCTDGKTGAGPLRPYPNEGAFGLHDTAQADANKGYMAGYYAGVEMRKAECAEKEGAQ